MLAADGGDAEADAADIAVADPALDDVSAEVASAGVTEPPWG